MTRQPKGVPQPILDAAFGGAQPSAGARTASLVALDGGDQAVMVLTAVKPGDTSTMSVPQRLDYLRGLSRDDGNRQFAAYVAYLKKQAKIQVNTKNLDQSSED